MGFKIEKPAPDVLKCACYPCPSIPRRLVHLLSALRPESDRDTSMGPGIARVALRSRLPCCQK